MMDTGDTVLSKGEFNKWTEEIFIPHAKADAESHAKTVMLFELWFGDGNGNPGMKDDVKSLICTSRRIDAWLDGIKRLWKILAAIILVMAALASLANSMHWI